MIEEERPSHKELFRLVNQCWLSITNAGKRALAKRDSDLTFEQLIALFHLRNIDGSNLKQLSDVASRDRTTMTRMVDGLERRDLVMRVPDKTDGRIKLVYLTRRGRELLEEMEPMAREFERQTCEELTADEMRIAIKVLETMQRSLDERV